MSLRFSIITPSFNQGPFIERTLKSVFSQTLAPDMYDYIVCDGGSTDTTLEILQQYSQLQGGNFRWISQPDAGQADAVNRGIAMTTGELIGWLNSDDIYYPETLQIVQALFTEHPEVEVIYGDAHHLDTADRMIESYPTQPWNYEQLQQGCYLCQPAVFFRRRLVERLGGLNSALHYCMDYELWLRWGKQVPFYYYPHPLAGSRLYWQTKTLSRRLPIVQETNRVLKTCLGQVPTKWILGSAHIAVEESAGYFYKFLWNPDTQTLESFHWLDHLLPETAVLPPAEALYCRHLDYASHREKRQFVNRWVLGSLLAFWHWNRQVPFPVLKQLLRLWGRTNYLAWRRDIKQIRP